MNVRNLGAMAMVFAAVGWASAQVPPGVNGPTYSAPGYGVPPGTSYPGGGVPGGPVMGGVPPSGINGPIPSGEGYLPPEATAPGASGPVVFGSAEYLLWKIKSGTLPPTAATVPVGVISVNISDLFTVNPALPAVQAGTPVTGYVPVSIQSNVNFGAGSSTDMGAQNGGRFTLGAWADQDQTWGVELGFFFLERGSDEFSGISSSGGNQFILDTGFTRNLFLVQGGQQSSLGTFNVLLIREARTRFSGEANTTLFGSELNARSVGLRIGCFDFGGLVGARWIGYRDELIYFNAVRLFRPPGIQESSGDASGSLSQDLTFLTADRIRIWNQFYGGQLGFDVDGKFGSFFISTRAKLAVGTMVQNALVESNTTVVNNDPAHLSPPSAGSAGGLLAGPLDTGSHARSRFSWIPECNVKLGYQLTTWLRGWVGYDVLYMSHVARTGSVSVVNTLNNRVTIAGTTQEVNVSQPTFRWRDQDVWVQGMNFGMEVRY